MRVHPGILVKLGGKKEATTIFFDIRTDALGNAIASDVGPTEINEWCLIIITREVVLIIHFTRYLRGTYVGVTCGIYTVTSSKIQ